MGQSVENLDFRYLMQNQKKIDVNAAGVKENKAIVEYDAKIVTFKIGDEYYGIDIMNVKSILKEKKFTRIPNSLDFVIGVLNLRGEILPVINLAKMFHLSSTIDKQEIKSIIIIKIENLMLGLVVEQIQHVMPIRTSDLQPPSPLLGSINEQYIDGVLHTSNRIYVVLNTKAIFSDKEKTRREILPQTSDLTEEFFTFFTNQIEEFCNIHINEVNQEKFRLLYDKYMKDNNISDMPKLDKDTALGIYKNFLSENSDEFWQEPYIANFKKIVLPELRKRCSDEVRVLNVGCANGYETFSMYILLQNEFPDAEIKMIAADVNLIAVSNASGIEVNAGSLPGWIDKEKYFMNVSGNSYKIKKEINDRIYFEFHDARNIATYKKIFDVVVARDISLYMKKKEYDQFINDLAEKITSDGILVLGDNENIKNSHYQQIGNERINILKKIK